MLGLTSERQQDDFAADSLGSYKRVIHPAGPRVVSHLA